MRRMNELFDFELDGNENIRKVRRIQLNTRKKKKKVFCNKTKFKYGVQVPRNIKEALNLDHRNRNSYWKESIEKRLVH